MPDTPGAAEAMRRRQAGLAALGTGPFDVLVVGGGSVGAGIALHATARGLRTALVERLDFAAGTSSRSTKLIHGGVRYLERAVRHADRAELRLVREALRERAGFFRLAPFLSRRLAILTPAFSTPSLVYLAAGLGLYDRLSGPASLGRSRVLGAKEAAHTFGALSTAGLRGAVLYYDGQFDDARLNVLLILTAIAQGAVAVNYARVHTLIKERGRVAGAEVLDELGGRGVTVRARAVINAAGAFGDEVRALDDPQCTPLLQTSSGVHLVVSGMLCPPDTGLLIPHTADGRLLFLLPWLGHTLIGTTDRAAAPVPRPAVAQEDRDYLLAHVNRHLARPLAASDVRSAWCGLRPLVRDPHRRGTAALARSHVIAESASGLVSVLGGKWTTYRRIAADAITHLEAHHGLRAGPAAAAEEVPVLGATGYTPSLAPAVAHTYGLAEDVAEHLAHNYGERMRAVAALVATPIGGRRLAAGWPYLEAEVIWGVREEMAQRVMDTLSRRLRLAFLDQRAAARAVPRVAAIMADELGWDDRRRAAEEAAAHEELCSAL